MALLSSVYIFLVLLHALLLTYLFSSLRVPQHLQDPAAGICVITLYYILKPARNSSLNTALASKASKSSQLLHSQINRTTATAAAAKSHQSCPTLCDPIDGSPTGSSIPGILQARTLEWVAISFSNAWKRKVKVKLLSRVQLSETQWTAAYPGSSVHGIFQARVLEWGAIAFSANTVY